MTRFTAAIADNLDVPEFPAGETLEAAKRNASRFVNERYPGSGIVIYDAHQPAHGGKGMPVAWKREGKWTEVE